MKKVIFLSFAIFLALAVPALAKTIVAEKGLKADLVLLPKFIGVLVFRQVNEGAQEAHTELGNTGELLLLGPKAGDSTARQIQIVDAATVRGKNAIMISNNAGDKLIPAAVAAQAKGVKVVTWDSPIPSASGEDLFVAQVDFSSTGTVLAKMTRSAVGRSGEVALLATSAENANQAQWISSFKEVLKNDYPNIKLRDTVYGYDDYQVSYDSALALIEKYPKLELIVSTSTVGIRAAAQAMQDKKLCQRVAVSGIGLPAELASYLLSGCISQFALWDFRDLGYLTYYTTYLLATNQMQGNLGEVFRAGRMGKFTIEQDPNRPNGKRVLMGPFKIYSKKNMKDIAKETGSPS